jgi:putative tryptophan/tyrosine transport system substrate-binding protein
MTRTLLSFALALSCVWGVGTLSQSVSRAAEPLQKVARVGFVSPNSPSTDPRGPAAFWERLRELGWVEGQNIAIEARWAEGRTDRLPALMAEVIGRNLDVLVTYSTPAAIAAKRATSTVPIVVAVMGNPVGAGLAVSLAHPGSNLTGLSMGFAEGMAGKWLELLQETVPRLSSIAVIENPDNPVNRIQSKELEAIAPSRGLRLWPVQVRDPEGLDRAFEKAGRQAQAVVVIPDPVFLAQLQRITALAAKHRLPAMYGLRDFVDAGGLLAYGPDRAVIFRRAADYVDKILKGTKPSDLPIEQPTKFELIVNLKTARALGITIPESILLRMDEVIR